MASDRNGHLYRAGSWGFGRTSCEGVHNHLFVVCFEDNPYDPLLASGNLDFDTSGFLLEQG